jgi:hypothetical protein
VTGYTYCELELDDQTLACRLLRVDTQSFNEGFETSAFWVQCQGGQTGAVHNTDINCDISMASLVESVERAVSWEIL